MAHGDGLDDDVRARLRAWCASHPDDGPLLAHVLRRYEAALAGGDGEDELDALARRVAIYYFVIVHEDDPLTPAQSAALAALLPPRDDDAGRESRGAATV